MPENKIMPTLAQKEPKESLTVADLYPNMSPEELAEAEYNLKQYVALVWRIYQRIKREKRKI